MPILRKKYSFLIFLAILLLVNFFIWNAVWANKLGQLEVAFLDIGQGDAIFIKSPSGNKMLIDGGPGSDVLLEELSKLLPFYDKKIDVVLATHPDQDHIGGLPGILDRFKVGFVIDTKASSDTRIFEEFKKSVSLSEAKEITAMRGMVIDLGGGAFFQVLFPDRDASGMDTNDSSIVGKLSFGESDFLLIGDSPKKIEDYLVLLDGENLESEVLKPGHHGSKTSSGGDFIKMVAPEYAVISAGKDNKYGHPHQEVLDVLNKFGIKILGTYDSGTVIFESDGHNLSASYK